MQFPEFRNPFHRAWICKHKVCPFNCWTDEGYDPACSDIPRDIQLLSCMCYGKSDIDNGGFHQFFGNGTGILAPEMIEWCDRSGLLDVAEVIRLAMKILAEDDYPRSQEARIHLLDKFPMKGSREQWDPFWQLDEKFYELLSNNGSRYDDAADQWLRETCGITQLEDPP